MPDFITKASLESLFWLDKTGWSNEGSAREKFNLHSRNEMVAIKIQNFLRELQGKKIMVQNMLVLILLGATVVEYP
jgi:hypothetical protein